MEAEIEQLRLSMDACEHRGRLLSRALTGRLPPLEEEKL